MTGWGQTWGAQGSPLRTFLKTGSLSQGRGSSNRWIRPRALPGQELGWEMCCKCGSQVLCRETVGPTIAL